MKCPKCGYLGFETTDRCRNCQYDFSLAPFRAESELALNDRTVNPPGVDFELPPLSRGNETPSTSLDLDRLFGAPESARDTASLVRGAPAQSAVPDIAVSDRAKAVDEPDFQDEPSLSAQPFDEVDEDSTATAPIEEDSLPFDDVPIVPPPAARTPLAVRRSTPDLPRNRPRTSRMPRTEALNLEPAVDATAPTSASVDETIASLAQTPSLVARIGAGAIDALLLGSVNLAVIYLTLRVTGLQNSLDDLRLLPPVPFAGFLAAITFAYVAAFTVGGGQTIGKMMLRLRVIGDDGRPVDAAGGVLRAAGCMLVPITLGLSYLPAIFTSEHRALHDRIAGTRVVQE